MDQALIDYIKLSRQQGRSDDEIKTLLLNAGHDGADVDAAFNAANDNVEPQAVQQPQNTVPQTQNVDPEIKSVEQTIGQIASVNSDVIPYIRARYFKRAIAIIIVLVAFEAGLVYLVISNLSNFVMNSVSMQTALQIGLAPFIIAPILWGTLKGRIEDAFMEQFAAINNFSFQKTGLPDKLDGFMFSLGHNQSSRDLVSGSFNNLPLSLFNYIYVVGYGRGSHAYSYTVFRLDYPSPLPPIFLKVRDSFFSLGGHEFGGAGLIVSDQSHDPEKIQLEGDFNKFFILRTKKGFETETLEVFAPDFMEKMKNDWKDLCLEFVGNHVYIYAYHEISTKVELDNMYSLAQYLIDKIGPLAERMKSDVSAMEDYKQPA
jgi:hypothetical protein